jgi:hypothetical protein
VEGEQKFNVPLDAPLDINSNDMLVPATSPKFSFNRQRFLGSVLQNSVRYEADGWFAGWWVHNFDLLTLGDLTITPNNLGLPSVSSSQVISGAVERYWTVRFNDVGLQFKFIATQYQFWFDNSSGSVTRTSDTVVTITGSTTQGDTFTVTTDAYSGAIIGTPVFSNPDLAARAYKQDGLYHLEVARKSVPDADMIFIRYGENVTVSGTNFVYNYNGTNHTWGSLVQVDGTGNLTLLNTTDYDLVNWQVMFANTADEYFDVLLRSKGIFTIEKEVSSLLVGAFDKFYLYGRSLEFDGAWVDDFNTTYITGRDDVNTEAPSALGYHPLQFDIISRVWDSWVNAEWHFPIWLKLGQLFDIDFEMDVFDRHILAPDPMTFAVNSWYECTIYLKIRRRDKSVSLQNLINDIRTHWDINIMGFGVTLTFDESSLPVYPAEPLRIKITGDRIDSRSIAELNWATMLTLRAINDEGPEFPVPQNHVWGAAQFMLNIKEPLWVELPPPYMPWRPDDFIEQWYRTYFDGTDPAGVPPADWANPVTYYPAWPAMPVDWLNPVPYPLAWRAKPTDWANPVVRGSLIWANPKPSDWAYLEPWPPAGYELGDYIPSADWHSATVSYIDYANNPSLKPALWPVMLDWPLTSAQAWEPPFPPNWPFGFTGLNETIGDPNREWFSDATTLTAYLTPFKPTLWPVTLDIWPLDAPAIAGWAARTPDTWHGTVNSNPPDIWQYPPWPPEWPFGIEGLPETDPPGDEWFLTAQTYHQWIEQYKDPNWPIPWAFWSLVRTGDDDQWPLEPEAGWVARTGSNPYKPYGAGWDVNPVAPSLWTPDWPIHWPYGVTAQPFGWYSVGTTYIDYVTQHTPYKHPAGDWASGGDPGWTWPGQLPYVWSSKGGYQATYLWQGNPTWPIVLPADYTLVISYVSDTGAVVFNQTPPANWPDHVSMPLQFKVTCFNVQVGPDAWYDPYRYKVLNRRAILPEDKHIFTSTDGYVYGEQTINCIFPLCFYAFVAYHIGTVDITLCTSGIAVKEAFESSPIGNTALGLKLFRLDTNGGEANSSKFALMTIEPYIMSVAPNPGNALVESTWLLYSLAIGYKNTKDVYFDKVTDYLWPERAVTDLNALTDIQGQVPAKYLAEYGFYPSWIVPSYGGTNYWKQYHDFGGQPQITHTAALMIMYLSWMQGTVNSSVTYAPMSAVNLPYSTLLQQSNLEIINAASRTHPWAPGVFDEEMLFMYDKSTGNAVRIFYNVYTKAQTLVWEPDPPDPWGPKSKSSVVFTHELQPREKHVLTLIVAREDEIALQVRRAFIILSQGLLATANIASATAANVILTTPFGNINRTSSAWSNHPGLVQTGNVTTPTTIKLNASIANSAHVRYLPRGIFWYNKKVTFISVSGNTLVFEYEGVRYTLVIGDGFESRLVFSTTDIRDNRIRELEALNTDDIQMAVKQFWSNDVTIENYWYIDDSHVLELSKYDMTLYIKTSELDDWNGDRWEIAQRAPRSKFIDNEDRYYSMSSAYGQRPIFFKLRISGASLQIAYITDIVAINFSAATIPWTNVYVPVRKIDLIPETAVKLSTSEITSFVTIDLAGLLSAGKISSTAVDGKLLIGLAATRGIQQWTLVISGGSASVVNGYGHVGHTGNLTGGQYPALSDGSLVDGTGFCGGVYPLEDFKDNVEADPDKGIVEHKVDGPDKKVFCSGASLWFVYPEVQNIVSHLLYYGSFVPVTMPLSNNYHCAVEISGAKTIAIFDTLPHPLGLVDLFTMADSTDSAATTALSYFSAIALPSIWYMQPVLVPAVLSAQGLHQAAYVIRNSLPVRSEDGNSDKDIFAVRGSYSVDTLLDLGKVQGLVALILGIAGSLSSQLSGDSLKVNAGDDSNAVSDTKGRKFSQFAARAVIDGVATALQTRGLVYGVKTKTTEQLKLSMFYTINDGAECWAGPGFVNHNFIGQCVSQGVATTKLKVGRFGAYLPLPIISALLLKGQMLAVNTLVDAVDDVFEGSGSGGNAGGGLFVQLPTGWIAGAIATALTTGTKLLLNTYDYMAQQLPQFYRTLGDVARGFDSGGVDRNTIDVEATHVYGNKPMSMMWPAFGANINDVTVERVSGKIIWEPSRVEQSGFLNCIIVEPMSTDSLQNVDYNNDFFDKDDGNVFSRPFVGSIFMPRTVTYVEKSEKRAMPSRMAFVEGITNMLTSESDLRNLQINCCDYTFPPPPIHDYIISEEKEIGVQAANGEIIAYSMSDVKLIDGPASNIVESGDFFGIASSYAAIEVKKTYDHNYLRPWAITPTCIALNISGINCVQMSKAYHGFDGHFNRITSWKGGSGLDMATMVQQYYLIVNDHFKRSNIIPPSEFFGRFDGPPNITGRTFGRDRIANQIMDLTLQKGLDINIPGEDRDLTRYSVPIHSETISTLPATVRILAPYKLHVVEGITSLTTDVRNTQTKYKAPSSVDFNLYDTMYRATEEYVALLTLQDGVVAVEDKTPSAGLTFIGATTKQAFFYSPATRMYYEFSGGGDITKRDIFNRFKDIKNGRWDFVNQEVVFRCLLDDSVFVDDVSGNFVARLGDRDVAGEIYPPNATIYNARSDFKIYSMAGGLVYQGPKRCVVNRFVITDDMYDMLKLNKKHWKKLDRELWAPGRDYGWHYDDWFTNAPVDAIYGWTHNPWRAATAMLGVSEETDCIYEWELTFAWTEQIAHVFEQNEFIVFNLAGETVTQGGTLLSRPTHLYLHKELFKNGYYTTRYTAKNGAGNRERLYMWGDGMSALEDLTLFAKEITPRRTQPLVTSQVDVQELTEQ